MRSKVIKRKLGFHYTDEGETFSVQTDYVDGVILLSEPCDNSDIEAIKAYGEAILRAVEDMKKDTGE